MLKTALITGATGTVGSALVRALAQAHIRPRAFVRDAEKARRLWGDAAELIVGDLHDKYAVQTAMHGVDALFLACANVADQVALECGAVDAARQAGVGRVVKLSARGAAHDSTATLWRAHAAVEDHLVDSGVPSVILRPSFFMTNLLVAADAVRAHGILPAPAGTAPIAMIDPADVAAVGVQALIDDSISAQVLTLNGPEALTYEQVAQRLSAVAGRHIRYVDIEPHVAAQQMMASGLPDNVTTLVLEVFERLRAGDDADANTQLPLLTGGTPSTVDGFVRQYAPAFADLSVRA